MHNRFNKGFTLIELLVVVAIIAILSGVVIGFVNGARAKAENARRISDMKEVQKALELYYLDHGLQYPKTAEYSGHPEAGDRYWIIDCYPKPPADSYWKSSLGQALKPYIKSFPSDPKLANCTSHKYYGYKSDGVSYKLKINNPVSATRPPSQNLIDPALDGGADPCKVDGTGIYSWALYSPDAACWK